VELIAPAGFDRLTHARHRVLTQELQDRHESARAGHRAVDSFQFRPKSGEACRELPVAEDRRVVQRTGLAVKRREDVERVEDHRLLVQGSCMGRDDLPLGDDHDAVDVALDRHHPKAYAAARCNGCSRRPRYTVDRDGS
jgi:hypothetical protein